MMLWRRSVTAVLSPFQQGAAVRSFTATVAIKVDEKEDGKINENLRSLMDPWIYEGTNKEFVQIRKQLRALNNCLTELRVGGYRDRGDPPFSSHVVIERAVEHLGNLTGLISEENLAQKNESDGNVKIIEDSEIDVQQLEAMLQKEGMKTRSTIQNEEKKNRLIDAIWKLGNFKTTDYFRDSNGAYVWPSLEDNAGPHLLRSILRAFLAGEGFYVKADDLLQKKVGDFIELGETHHLRLRKTLSVAIADLTGTKPKYEVHAKNGFMIYHG